MKLKTKKHFSKDKFTTYLGFFLIFILILFLSVGFSAFQNRLAIENMSANVRIDKYIRITGVSLNSTSEANSYYE